MIIVAGKLRGDPVVYQHDGGRSLGPPSRVEENTDGFRSSALAAVGYTVRGHGLESGEGSVGRVHFGIHRGTKRIAAPSLVLS